MKSSDRRLAAYLVGALVLIAVVALLAAPEAAQTLDRATGTI